MRTKLGLCVVILASVFLSTGCSMKGWHDTTQTQVYQASVGANINAIIPIFGPPSDVFTLPNGDQMYTWMEVDGVVVSMNYYRNKATISQKYCKKVLSVRANGTIYASQVTGNVHDCQ